MQAKLYVEDFMKEYQENHTSTVLNFMLLKIRSKIIPQSLLLVFILRGNNIFTWCPNKFFLRLSRTKNLNASLFVFSQRIKVKYCMEKT